MKPTAQQAVPEERILVFLEGKCSVAESGLIVTGITGLDEILLGGVPRGRVILLQGVTGSGKTLMGRYLPRNHTI